MATTLSKKCEYPGCNEYAIKSGWCANSDYCKGHDRKQSFDGAPGNQKPKDLRRSE